ncbi:MAG: NlpC/P60 family protein [Pseudomonadota bacterium]
MSRGEELARAAATFVGTPFRLYGRNAQTGLDCVGLLLASLTAIGIQAVPVRGYRLRNCSIEPWLECATRWNLVSTEGPVQVGDVLIVVPGPSQHHIMIASQDGSVIHAHAGLKRVVHEPVRHAQSLVAHFHLMN